MGASYCVILKMCEEKNIMQIHYFYV
uniref:Uncharacterized protein n=1 Tax=Anguilla anguilla TaxID=7936 RepID=A0A0E9VCF7_ANGAN